MYQTETIIKFSSLRTLSTEKKLLNRRNQKISILKSILCEIRESKPIGYFSCTYIYEIWYKVTTYNKTKRKNPKWEKIHTTYKKKTKLN